MRRRKRCPRCYSHIDHHRGEPAAVRFETALDRTSVPGCWLWTRARLEDGYVKFWADGLVMVHRWAWEQFKGPIPKGQRLYNTCGRRHCMNPAHWFPGSPALAKQRRGSTRNPEMEAEAA